MNDNNINKPKLRFPGFTDAWEQRTLGSFGKVYTGNTPPTSDSDNWADDEKGHVWITPTDIDSLIMSDSERHLSDQGWSKARTIPENSVLITSIASIGKNAINTVPVAFNQQINAIVPEDNDAYFILSAMVRDTVRFAALAGQTATAIINKTTFEKFNLSVPTLEEQQKIGGFFKELDHLITLHQRKLEHLQKRKKALLQKMFPKNGESYPEVRFPGFTDAWEQRKLRDVSKRVRGNDGRMDLPTLTISAGKGWLDQRERFSANIAGNEQKNYTLLSKGELSYNHGNSKLAKYGAVFELRNYEEALVPRVYHSFKPTNESSSDFIEYMFATKLPDRELAKLVSSGARMDGLLNINYDDFMGIKITIPKVDEQERIAQFLRKVDYTITLHQRKLEHLQERKKALLQQMFI